MGRVRWGKGTGWTYPTLALPVPLLRVGGLPANDFVSFPSEFEFRSTVTNSVDLAFYHSNDIPLDSTKAAGPVKQQVVPLKPSYYIFTNLFHCF